MISGKKLDVEAFASQRVSAVYPCFEIVSFNDTLPLVISSLEKGDIPLVAVHEGKKKIACRISSTAFNISKLLRTQGELICFKSATEFRHVNRIQDYLEVILWIFQ